MTSLIGRYPRFAVLACYLSVNALATGWHDCAAHGCAEHHVACENAAPCHATHRHASESDPASQDQPDSSQDDTSGSKVCFVCQFLTRSVAPVAETVMLMGDDSVAEAYLAPVSTHVAPVLGRDSARGPPSLG